MNRIIHIIHHTARAAATLLLTVLTAATAWAETKTVSYIDADGNTQTVTATVLKSTYSVDDPEGFVGELEAGWYVVSTSFSYTSQVHTPTEGNTGIINIILADGAEMSVQNNSGGNAIYLGSQYPLAIYGQSAGTGRLTVTCESDVTAIYANGGFTINGGIVTATGKGTFRSGIYANHDFTINGGQLTATGPSYYGISAETITLGGGTITANGGSGGYNGTVSIALPDGYIYSDGTNTYANNSTLTDAQNTAIAGKTLTVAIDPAHFSQSGDTYTIHTAGGWNVFCDLLNQNAKGFFTDKTIVLGTDITVSRMAGGSYHDFTGTFDGGGHTLTVNYGSASSPIDEDKAAPFRNVETGCVIENLHVSGDIYASQKYAGGLVGTQYGAVTIRNCHVSTVIHSLTSGDGTHGGIVGNIGNSSSTSLTIEGCLFDGKLLSYGETATNSCGGLVGYKGNNASATITNSLYAPAALAEDETEISTGATFVRNGSVGSNCYYTRVLGDAQGIAPRTVSAATEDVTVSVSPVGEATATYTLSGITAYEHGIQRGETFYYGEGDPVTLTLSNTASAPLGYCYVDYSASHDDGITLADGSTLTMPDTDVTISLGALRSDGQQHSVTYIDADGTAQTAQAVALDGTETSLAAGWYFVGLSTVAFDHTLNLSGNVTLILADGCTMNVGKSESRISGIGISTTSGSNALTIYGQSLGSGHLYMYSTSNAVADYGSIVITGNLTLNSGNVTIRHYGDYGFGIHASNNLTVNGGTLDVTSDEKTALNTSNAITINGGTVTANAYSNGLHCTGGDITINGGIVNATGRNFGIFAAYGTITIGWTNPTDRITASSYSSTVTVADGQALTDGSGHFYSGTLGSDERTAIGGKTLRPCLALTDTESNIDAITSHNDQTIAVALSGRTLYKDGKWNTICLPFDLELSGSALDGATAHTVTAANISGTTLNLTFGDAVTTLVAGTPYIIKWANDTENPTIVSPVFSGVTISADKHDYDTAEESVTTDERVRFVGTYDKKVITDNEANSILLFDANNKLRYAGAGAGLGACRAYFKIGADAAAQARRLTSFNINFGDDDNVTGIISVTSEARSNADGWYSLDGRKLAGEPTVSGIYINNGKKVVIK